MAEMQLGRLAAEHGLPLVIIRPSIVETVPFGHLKGWRQGWAGA